MLKSDVVWPNSRRYKSHSEWEPIGFFSDCLCNATRFDLKLGFFSTSAINVLSDGFAAFLYNGGRMRLIINDVLSQQDKDIINKAGDSSAIIPAISLNDIAKLKETLSQRGRHFFDCIAWLIRNNRIEISKDTLKIPVIAIGIPTVVDATTIVQNTLQLLLKQISYQLDKKTNISVTYLKFSGLECYHL